MSAQLSDREVKEGRATLDKGRGNGLVTRTRTQEKQTNAMNSNRKYKLALRKAF